ISGKKTYDQYIGNAALKKKGKKAWNKRVAKAIDILRVVVRFDHLYIGGGNAKHLGFPLPRDVSVVSNIDGLTGGIELWRAMPSHIAAGTGAIGEPGGPAKPATQPAGETPERPSDHPEDNQRASDTPA
ncbi:MAG: hypothetical protein JO007_17025, partial [Alphaproteobacteria bacterium]|nr:hypothetical protein [Alphaproteobacteria bacterium]